MERVSYKTKTGGTHKGKDDGDNKTRGNSGKG